MIIAQANEMGTDWLQIRAIPEEGDAFMPVDSLAVRLASTASYSPDRLAVAGAIAFHPWVSSMLQFGRDISPLTAQRMGRAFAPRWISINPVMRRAYPLPRGHADIVVSSDELLRSESPTLSESSTLRFSPIGDEQGAVATSSGVVIPSNAPILEELYPNRDAARGAAILAAAILVAEPAGAARMLFDAAAVSPRVVRRFSALVEATGLTIATRDLRG